MNHSAYLHLALVRSSQHVCMLSSLYTGEYTKLLSKPIEHLQLWYNLTHFIHTYLIHVAKQMSLVKPFLTALWVLRAGTRSGTHIVTRKWT